MLSRIFNMRVFNRQIKTICLFAAMFSFFCVADLAAAANIKVLPSASRVSPGENFYIDISVENIPSNGLDTVQFKLNVNAPGSAVVGVPDLTNSGAGDVSISTPLTIGLPTLNRSGIGEFFWNANGPYGILVMDNEELKNGKSLYAFAHTNNSMLPSGNGSIARFYFTVGKDVAAEKIEISLTDVALLNAGNIYQLDANTGATIELRCLTKAPDLLGLTFAEAQSALQQANLIAGNIYEIDNQSGSYALNKVLAQSYASGASVICGTSVNLAINTSPSEVSNAAAVDKAGDESGAVTISWIPSASADTAGYRIYLVSGSQGLLKEIRNPVAAGAEISGLINGQVSQLKITAFDNFGNESQGVVISAAPIDDIPPRITVSGVTEGAVYSSAVLPIIDILDANLSAKEILLNGIAYAMALIGIDGNYTLKVTATDSSGNTTVKEIHFAIDSTPPVSTINIGEPQYKTESNIYISDKTEISISAIDSVSGVRRIEYSIDNAPFAEYTVPITLASYSEGLHTIKYRSTDNIGNTETGKTISVTLDKTMPKTTISASDPLVEGVVNVVSPKTMFNLISTDALSGVKETRYKIDNGSWKTYMADFGLSSLAAGIHTVSYKAVDNVLNEETENTITLKLINIDVTKEISSNPVVLAGAWHVDDNDDNKEQSKKDKESAIDNLVKILTASGVSYYIPQSDDNFKEVLRSGRFTTYLLIDFKNEEIGKEIREAVNYGDGLIFIKTKPFEDPSLDVFGVKFNGKSTDKGLPVYLLQSPISNHGVLQTEQNESRKKVVKTEIISTTAQSLGYAADKKETYPVIVSNQYGRGKAILFSFDLLNCPDQAKTAELLLNSINHVTPTDRTVRALDSAAVNIKINNQAEAVDLKITETIPAETTVDSINPQAMMSANSITWLKTLNAGEKAVFGYYLNLPDKGGDYTLNTEVRYNNNGYYRFYETYSLKLSVINTSSYLLQTIITGLNSLPTLNKEDAKKISEAVEILLRIDSYALNRTDADNNIMRITSAIDKIKDLSFDASDIRLKLDEILKIWEKKWYLMKQ